MPTFKSLASYAAQMDKVTRELDIEARRKITRAQAEAAQKIATAAAEADIGGSFSGWRRGKPIELETKIRDGRGGSTLLTPTRQSAGPWTVAEKGRNQGGASGFAGPGVNIRTGLTTRRKDGSLRKVRARKSKRWNGQTAGKNTATEAQAAMDRDLPKIADKQFGVVLRTHFDVT